MQGALTLARRSLGQTWPNPAVGCVLVRGGRVIGRGSTARTGRPHAETEALAMARARGHDTTGGNGLCDAGALRSSRTHAALRPGAGRCGHRPASSARSWTPTPASRAAGFEALRGAGISVDIGLMSADARAVERGLPQPYRARQAACPPQARDDAGRQGSRPAPARAAGSPAPPARRVVHLMRARSDAILVGAATARADDPMLDCARACLADRAPVRIVADAGLSLSLTSRLAASAAKIPTWILHRHGAPTERHDALPRPSGSSSSRHVPPANAWMLARPSSRSLIAVSPG